MTSEDIKHQFIIIIREEMEQFRDVPRQCETEAGEICSSLYVNLLLIGSQWRSKSNSKQFWTFALEASWAADRALNIMKENLRRVSKESITITKPRQYKRQTKSWWLWTGLNWSIWSPGDCGKSVRVCSATVPSVRADCQSILVHHWGLRAAALEKRPSITLTLT